MASLGGARELVACPDGGQCGHQQHEVNSAEYRRCAFNNKRRAGGLRVAGGGAVVTPSRPQVVPAVVKRASVGGAWNPDDGFSPSPISLRPEQDEASTEIASSFLMEERDRAQIRAACGMGKTIMIQESIRKYDEGLVKMERRHGVYLVMAPTINLSDQIHDDFVRDGVISGEYLKVHSRSEELKTARRGSRTDEIRAADVARIKEFLSEESDQPRVLFVVNDSVGKVVDAQKECGIQIDIALFDEAHNLATVAYKKVKSRKAEDDEPGVSSPLRVYHNDQPNSLQASNRVFLTATTRVTSGVRISEDAGTMLERLIKANQAEDSDGDTPPIILRQDCQDMFGDIVGSKSWGYRHAVDQGYLMKPTVSLGSVYIGSDHPRAVDRSDKVDASGWMSPTQDGGISVGAFVSAAASMDSITDSDSRNVLVFSNSISEADAVKKEWSGIARARAASIIGREMDDAEAFEVASTARPGVPLTSEQKAARLFLVGSHASVISVSASSSAAEQSAAPRHFDQDTPGDAAPCTCGRPGGWCACARVVSNVDLFSEGISINSVDTVVFNRKRGSEDGDVYQAMGRASRRWGPGGGYKKQALMVIPDVHFLDTSTNTEEPVLNSFKSRVLGAVSRVYRDTDVNALRAKRIMRPEAPLAEYEEDHHNLDIPVTGVGMASALAHEFPAFSDGSGAYPDQAILLSRMWDRAYAGMVAEERRSNKSFDPRTLSSHAAFLKTVDYVKGHAGDTRSDLMSTLSTIVDRVTPSMVDQAKAYAESIDRKFGMGDNSLTQEEVDARRSLLVPSSVLRDVSDPRRPAFSVYRGLTRRLQSRG